MPRANRNFDIIQLMQTKLGTSIICIQDYYKAANPCVKLIEQFHERKLCVLVSSSRCRINFSQPRASSSGHHFGLALEAKQQTLSIYKDLNGPMQVRTQEREREKEREKNSLSPFHLVNSLVVFTSFQIYLFHPKEHKIYLAFCKSPDYNRALLQDASIDRLCGPSTIHDAKLNQQLKPLR